MSKVTIETTDETALETIAETIDIPATEILAVEAAQAAVVAAESAIQLANTQAAIVNAEAAEIVTEALTEIEQQKDNVKWHENQITNLQEQMTSLQTQVAQLVELMHHPASLTPQALAEVEPNPMQNLSETGPEISSVTQTEAPESVEAESPAEILEVIADKAKRRIRLI